MKRSLPRAFVLALLSLLSLFALHSPGALAAALITLNAPAPGTVIAVGQGASLSAQVNLPPERVKKVEFFRDGYRLASQTIASASTAGTSTWAWAWSKPAAGSYLITAEVTERDGTLTESDPVLLEVDRLPTVKLISPRAGMAYAAPASVFFDVEASDSDGSIARVEFWQGTMKLGSATGYSFEHTWRNVPAGSYTVFARAVDDLGLSADTPPVTIVVAGGATVSLSAPEDHSVHTLPVSMALGATASAGGNGRIASVEFYAGTTLVGTDTTSPYGVSWTPTQAGTYRLTARALDGAGGAASSAPRTVTILPAVPTQEADGLYFIEVDHLETPRLIADGQGRTVWRWENEDPFGDNPPEEDPDGDGRRFRFNLRFPGQYFDQETGLHYNFFRDYDPGLGRYTTSDPIGTVLYRDMAARSLISRGAMTPELALLLYRTQPEFNHLYTYGFGNPLRYIDPLGLSVVDGAPNPEPPPIKPSTCKDWSCGFNMNACKIVCNRTKPTNTHLWYECYRNCNQEYVDCMKNKPGCEDACRAEPDMP